MLPNPRPSSSMGVAKIRDPLSSPYHKDFSISGSVSGPGNPHMSYGQSSLCAA